LAGSSSAPIVDVIPGKAVSPLAQGIRCDNMLFLSGQVAVDPVTDDVIEVTLPRRLVGRSIM
jgi:enamine deaminase RidA (YjgF/YER057c/UK114 family)